MVQATLSDKPQQHNVACTVPSAPCTENVAGFAKSHRMVRHKGSKVKRNDDCHHRQSPKCQRCKQCPSQRSAKQKVSYACGEPSTCDQSGLKSSKSQLAMHAPSWISVVIIMMVQDILSNKPQQHNAARNVPVVYTNKTCSLWPVPPHGHHAIYPLIKAPRSSATMTAITGNNPNASDTNTVQVKGLRNRKEVMLAASPPRATNQG